MKLPVRVLNSAGIVVAAIVPIMMGHDGDFELSQARSGGCADRPAIRFTMNPAGNPLGASAGAGRSERWAVEVTGADVRDLPPLPSRRDDPNAGMTHEAQTAWTRVLALYATSGGGDADALPPVIGRYELHGQTVRFVPRYAPMPGVTYVARGAGAREISYVAPGASAGSGDGAGVALAGGASHVGGAGGGASLGGTAVSHTAGRSHAGNGAGRNAGGSANDGAIAGASAGAAAGAQAVPLTRVAAIYPTSTRVPANLLKLHLDFSAPMGDGEAAERLHLIDARGREVNDAFLRVSEELWDASRRRLTVMFDPGRIKRGLRGNLEEGAPLEEGRTFRLVVDAAWRDAHGRPLAAGAIKTLVVGDADRRSPDWHRWEVEAPVVRSLQPLTVTFDEPLDRVLLERWLVVVDADGRRLEGDAFPGPMESSWSFVPATPWRAGGHRVLIDPRIEDRAANRLTSLFDVDLSQEATSPPPPAAAGPIALAFTPLPPHASKRGT